MSAVGSWAWAQQTGGRLSRRNKAELVRQGALAQLSRMPAAWHRVVAKDARSVALPAQPDTPLAREAESHARELCDPVLFNHCLRTWAFSAMFAQRDQVDHDEELLFVACVLHDLGLTNAHDGNDPTAECFAVEGARAAHSFVCANGGPEDRARVVGEAISLHLNVSVRDDFGPVAGLLSKGVMLDAVGRRAERISPGSVSSVVAAWPREGSGELLIEGNERQATLRPASRSALLRHLGFTKLVRSNPIDQY
jgi:hypothetical protein